jgi:hypothetical protein
MAFSFGSLETNVYEIFNSSKAKAAPLRPVPKIKAFYDAAAIKVLVLLETVVSVLYPLSFPFCNFNGVYCPNKSCFFLIIM